MTLFTLPTSRPVTQDWNQDFQWLNGRYYAKGFYSSIGWRGHNGIDYGCHEGDPIEAVCDGVIEYIGPGNNHWLLTGGGNTVLLRNDELGIRFEYLHLSRYNVAEGQRVSRGQVIAYSGNTGISTAPHLHLGAIPVHNVNVTNGYRGRIDPTPYLYGSMNPDYAGGAAIAPQGTITPSEDDEMTPEQARQLARLVEIGEANEKEDIRSRIKHIDERTLAMQETEKYIRSDHPDEPTLYEINEETGELRGISGDEWRLTGKGWRYWPKAAIDRLLGK